jgi:hypothetical protein
MKPGRVLLFGLMGLVLAQMIAWWQRQASPLLSAILAVAAGSIPLVIDYVKETYRSPPPARDSQSPANVPKPRPPRPTAAGLSAALLVLVLLGGAAYGASFAVGLFTGWEPRATERLTAPVTGKAGALRVPVEQVKVGTRFTQVRLTATNSAEFPVSVPLFNNCQIVAPGRVTLEAKTGFTTSVIEVPPGSVPITKDVVFTGTPSASATSLTLTCNRLFWQGFGQPTSLRVKKIALQASG